MERRDPRAELDRPSIVRGAIAGAAGGVAGSFVMSLVSRLWTRGRRGHTSSQEESLFHHGGRPDVEAAKKQGRSSGDPEAVAITATAERLAAPVVGKPFSRRQRHVGGILVHYCYGAMAGAFYGASVERTLKARAGSGIGLGLSLWRLGIPFALPAPGLSAPASDYSVKDHSYGVTSHVAYGLVAELTRRAVRSRL